MQRQNSDELTNAAPAPAINALDDDTATNNNNNNNNNNNLIDGGGGDEIDLAASLSRIDALADSLASITRKRPTVEAPSTSRSKRRGSINSTSSSISGGVSSFAGGSGVDELLHNLEGLEFDIVNNENEMSMSRLSLNGYAAGGGTGGGADSSSNWNGAGSVSSRLSSGLWSLQDVEQWCCTTCTYENEPVFWACEMCGHTRPARASRDETTRENGDDEAVKARQEQRLSELRQFQKPAATTTDTSTTSDDAKPPAVADSRPRSKSPLPPSSRHRSHSPLPPSSSSSHRSRPLTPKSLSPKQPGGGRRARGLGGSSHHSLSLPGLADSLHGSSGLTNSGGESSMHDLFASSDSSLHKPRRLDPQNHDSSAHTSATFDMSASASSFDFFSSEHMSELMVYPEEEDDDSFC